MPWFEVDGDRAFTTTSLVYIARCRVENPEHWYDTIRLPVCTPNVRLVGPNIVDVHTDTTRPFGNLGTLREGTVDTVNRVLLVCNQETRRHLGSGCTRVKQCW